MFFVVAVKLRYLNRTTHSFEVSKLHKRSIRHRLVLLFKVLRLIHKPQTFFCFPKSIATFLIVSPLFKCWIASNFVSRKPATIFHLLLSNISILTVQKSTQLDGDVASAWSNNKRLTRSVKETPIIESPVY